jgi:hypothetical protein
MKIDKDSFEYAIAKIDDGKVYESFAKDFLAAVLGHEFVPVGQSKDKGVDSFRHIFARLKKEKQIFQMSTELDFQNKVYKTINTLNENEISFTHLVYATNRKINNAESFIDEVYDRTGVVLQIFDIRWFSAHSNESEKTIRAYQVFVETYLHEYTKPGQYQSVANLDSDSRLFVFLAQQFDSNRADLKLDDLLFDSLILYALEGTDPVTLQLKSSDDIKVVVRKYIKFADDVLDQKIKERLDILCKKPKKINFHSKEKAYCLPFETRFEIEQRNLKDELLFKKFYADTHATISRYFNDTDVKVKDIEAIITRVFQTIFSRQGLEFSNFVLKGDNQSVIEQNLHDVISTAVDGSSVVLKNKEKVKTALHLAIRDIVYNGSPEQRKFLKSLSNTYLMMFLLQWEPKLSIYFQTLAAKLKIFVDNSIVIPALSEFYLSSGNRRHWNLLVGAKKAGIQMFINESILDELVAHINMVSNKFHSAFSNIEDVYLNDDFELLFIEEIMIRSYFYAKRRGLVMGFNAFLDNFVHPDLKNTKDDLITYLNETFGIQFISNTSWDIKVDEDEKIRLTEVLKSMKGSEKRAVSDAEMILAIYFLRKRGEESSSSGIFGYKTWWLSKDTSTYKAVIQCFGATKYPVSCYIRPDFIYNYIALRPSSDEINEAYQDIFPTMLGVNLSYHMPREVSETVQRKLQEFHSKQPVRVKQTLKLLSDKLKSDPTVKNRHYVEHFLDEQLRAIPDA